MGKSYVENSLKRFLKRKVRVTLGLVVTFMITGAVSFALSRCKTIKIDEYHQKYNLDGILTAKDNLTGLGNGVISAGENNQYVEIEKTADKTIIKKAEDKSVIAEIDNSLISSKTAETVSTALQGMDGTSAGEQEKEIIKLLQIMEYLREQQTASNSIIYLTNNGIINSQTQGQTYGGSVKGMTFINNGIINSSKQGQVILGDKENLKLENNGIVYSGTAGQHIVGKGVLINNGIIKNNSDRSQYLSKSDSKAINNGVLDSASTGQGMYGDIKNSFLINNGIIKGSVGQETVNSENKALNYGIISSNGSTATGQSGTGIYNYGLISSEVIGMNRNGYHYGVIKVVDVSKAFSGDVTNKGIVIADSGELAPKYSTGIFLTVNIM